ncbi:hypothetical protein D2Q93_08315 [Alicyclobacillaceae bacterium I2511]|nr:hypothetical protein D2Q93_08315 [Alicyclobacillaceae bacterium I2511]
MKIDTSSRFDRQYVKLVRDNPEIRMAVLVTAQHLEHFSSASPSFRFKHVQRTNEVYECSVNATIRMTLEFTDDDVIMLRNIDDYRVNH